MTTETPTLERGELTLTWGGATDAGKVRPLNEDGLLTAPGLFVVADGMGGHAAGDVASRLTIDVCREAAARVPLTLDEVEAVVTAANQHVRAHRGTTGVDGMGTTLVGVVLVDNGGTDSLLVVNVGDSRCYVLDPDGELRQMTVDHSLVQEMVARGEITEADAATHRQRNVVTRAIGIEEKVAADFVVLPRERCTRILLCSDGVSGELSEDALAEELARPHDPPAVARAVVDRVLEGPARDNATAVVIDVHWDLSEHATTEDPTEVVTGPRPEPQPDRDAHLIADVPFDGTRPVAVSASAPIDDVPV